MIDDLQEALNTYAEINKMHITTFEADKEDMTQCYKQLIEKYEQVRKALIVAEAKVMSEHDSMTSQQEELKNEISALKYRLRMGEEKVQAILNRQKQKMHQAIRKALDEGWKQWSAQADELQLLRVDHENWKKQG